LLESVAIAALTAGDETYADTLATVSVCEAFQADGGRWLD
jgi:hypothetical protein